MKVATKLSLFVNRLTTRLNLLILLLLLIASSLGFTVAINRIEGFSGGTKTMDTLFSYSPEDAYSMIDSFGDEGWAYYIFIETKLDFVYPIIYTFFAAILYTLIFNKILPSEHILQRLHIFPSGALLVDYMENVSIIILVKSFPAHLNSLARLASIFTSIKWILLGLNGVILIVGGIYWFRMKFRARRG